MYLHGSDMENGMGIKSCKSRCPSISLIPYSFPAQKWPLARPRSMLS